MGNDECDLLSGVEGAIQALFAHVLDGLELRYPGL